MVEVSVVIVTCNREKEFSRAFNSVIQQKGVNIELIVIDNNSSDGTKDKIPDLIKSSSWTVLPIFLSENVGPTKARATGFRKAKGEVVYFLDDDAYIKDLFFLKKLKMLFDRNPEIGCVQTGIYDTQKEGLMYTRHRVLPGKDFFLATSYIGASHALRKSLEKGKRKEELFPEWIFCRSEEFFTALVVYDLGYLVAYYPKLEVIHEPSPSMRPAKGDMEIQTIINKHSIRWTIFPKVLLPLSFLAFFSRLIKHYGWDLNFLKKTLIETKKNLPKKHFPRLKIDTFLFLIKKFGFKPII